MAGEVHQELQCREYQVELFEMAKEKNLILYLPTGSGKTFIAVLLIKHFSNKDKERIYLPIEKGGVKSFFLVNTVALVNQQAKQIESQTTLTVGRFSGDMGVDLWKEEMWRFAINEKQVIVMTTQIFLDILEKHLISLENVNLLIFDECHRAVSNHPMRQVMQNFNNVPLKKQPRVLGLTATLLNGNIKPTDVEKEIRNLEITLNAEIQTSLNEDMVKLYSTNPAESRVSYLDNDCSHDCYTLSNEILANLKDLVVSIRIDERFQPPENCRPNNCFLVDNSRKTNKKLVNLIDDVEYNMKELGIYGGSLGVLAHLVQLQQMLPNVQDDNCRIIYQTITGDLVFLRKFLEYKMRKSQKSDLEKLLHFSSDKVIKLFAILKLVKPTDSAIVFVQRRFSAKVLFYLLDKASKVDSKLSHVKCNFVVGYNVGNPFKDTRENYLQRKQNTIVMNNFNKGDINVLFASNVVEEGVDISKCNYVIMFDTVLDFRAYVQSKGRARDRDSQFVLMVSKTDTSFDGKYKSYQQIEDTLKDILYGGKSRLRIAPTLQDIDEKLFATIPGLEPYSPKGPNGPVITALSAIPAVNRYFSSLKIDKFTKVNHAWFMEKVDLKFRCHLQLPMEAKNPILVTGTFQSTIENAKRSAALEACKILHKSRDLSDEHLLPVDVEVIKNASNFTPNSDKGEIFEGIVDGKSVKIGTKKNKRTYKKKWADTLFGCAPEPNKEIYLHLIEISTMYNPPLDNHRLWMVHDFLSRPNYFAILSSKKLPPLASFPLYMSTGELEANIREGTKITLNNDQLEEISRFHLTIFDSVLEVAKMFMIRDLTNTHNAYLIAPVVKDGVDVNIDWGVIEECRKPFLTPLNRPTNEDRRDINITDENYFGRIITPWYRTVPSQKYIVTKVCHDMSEETRFPTESFENYKEYFKDKYKIEPLLIGQPLLEVKAISSRLNSIKPRALTKQLKRKKDENEEFEVWLLPEFCIVYPLPGKYWLKAQLLPSALHRVSQLCLAEELRRSIAQQTGIGTIKRSSQWLKLKEDFSLKKNQDPDQDKPQALKPLNLNQSNWKSHVPDVWASEEEPVDIERHMESVTVFDVFTYENFINKSFLKTLIGNGNISLSDITGPTKNYNNKMVTAPSLDILKNKSDLQQVDLLQALTAASSNDFINCERLETLGDSFLKFAVSVTLFETQENLTEGHLTSIKGEIVGNKNLYFCGKKKNLGPMLGVDEFSPKEDWVPPGFHVPQSVQDKITKANLNVNCLYSVQIPEADRKCHGMTSTAYDLFANAFQNSEDGIISSQNCGIFNQIAMTDKNISDAVEAILGVYLKSNGILGALKVMNWFGVTDPNLSTVEVLTGRSKSAARGSGDPNDHLHQPDVLESILNYKFHDRSFLLQALTHPSYTRNNITKCYQNLEFLGDAVIDFLITIYIFEKCSTLTPGDLTDLRSALVNNVTLACLSVRNDFQKFLLYHSFKLHDSIARFAKNQQERNHAVDKDVLFLVEENEVNEVNISEAIDVPKALGDVFESLIGAIYLDSGKSLDVTWKVVFNLMKTEIQNFSEEVPKNHVRMLYESGSSPEFLQPIEKSGVIMVVVEIKHSGQTKRFNGFGDNKQQARRAAAKHALRHMRSLL